MFFSFPISTPYPVQVSCLKGRDHDSSTFKKRGHNSEREQGGVYDRVWGKEGKGINDLTILNVKN